MWSTSKQLLKPEKSFSSYPKKLALEHPWLKASANKSRPSNLFPEESRFFIIESRSKREESKLCQIK